MTSGECPLDRGPRFQMVAGAHGVDGRVGALPDHLPEHGLVVQTGMSVVKKLVAKCCMQTDNLIRGVGRLVDGGNKHAWTIISGMFSDNFLLTWELLQMHLPTF